MASRVDGIQALQTRLRSFERDVVRRVDAMLDEEVRRLQQETADLVPVDTGRGRDAILSPEAIRKEPGRGAGGSARWTFGFITRRLRDQAYYLFWVEFGTKAYEPGDQRSSGVDKRGRRRFRRIKRRIPARRAQPFFRPAVAAFMRRMEQRRGLAAVFAAAAEAAGLNGRVR